MNIGSLENIDFDVIWGEIEKRVKATDRSKDWLQLRDTWMFVEGVSLFMQYDSPENKIEFRNLCNKLEEEYKKAVEKQLMK